MWDPLFSWACSSDTQTERQREDVVFFLFLTRQRVEAEGEMAGGGRRRLVDDGEGRRELWWVHPHLREVKS
jgi:hypothetical protein